MTIRSQPVAFNAPVEIVKTILDTAARDRKSTAATLMHVCRTTREWAIPILYESVDLDDNPSSIQFEHMLRIPSSTPRLASSIKHLRAKCFPSVDLLSGRCSEVEAISLYNYDVPKLHRLALPSLRHVTVVGSLRYTHFDSNMSGLATVTHLRFPNDVPRLPDNFVKAVPKLTHFSCCYLTAKKSRREEEKLERCLSTVLGAPALRVAMIFVHSSADEADSLGSLACVLDRYASDPRVIMASTVELRDAIENISPTYDRLWKFGEKRAMQPRFSGQTIHR